MGASAFETSTHRSTLDSVNHAPAEAKKLGHSQDAWITKARWGSCVEDNWELVGREGLRAEIEAISKLKHDETYFDYESLTIVMGSIETLAVYEALPDEAVEGELGRLLKYLDRICQEEFGRRFDFQLWAEILSIPPSQSIHATRSWGPEDR